MKLPIEPLAKKQQPVANTAEPPIKAQRTFVTTVAGLEFPVRSPTLEAFGLKFADGGAHISRTMMLAELGDALASVPPGSMPDAYRAAVLDRNALGKTTVSTRKKSLRHLRELYGLDESIPIFSLLRKLDAVDPSSRALLALQTAWSRDPLLRATTQPIVNAAIGDPIDAAILSREIEAAYPDQYSELNCAKIARNTASSWTQSGHLVGRLKKIRRKIQATPVALTMALLLGQIGGYHGSAVFTCPWVRLLDLTPDLARSIAQEAHRADLLNLRAVGDVVDLSFPMLDVFRGTST
jgi:hypothetical protein